MKHDGPDKFKRAHVTSTPQRTGLDDGPELPSARAIESACKKIEAAALQTDAERLNWLESKKYFQVGIGFDGAKYCQEIRFTDRELKRFFGRSLRAAIDTAMDADKPRELRRAPTEYGGVVYTDDQPITE